MRDHPGLFEWTQYVFYRVHLIRRNAAEKYLTMLAVYAGAESQ